MKKATGAAMVAAFMLLVSAASGLCADDESIQDLTDKLNNLKTDCFEQRQRETAMRALSRKNNLQAAKVLATCLDDPFVHIRELAVSLFPAMDRPEIAIWLSRTILFSRSKPARKNAAEALGLMKKREALDGLLKAVADRDPAVGEEAARAIGRIGDADGADGLLKRLSSYRGPVKGEVFRTLGVLNRLPDDKTLESAFKDSKWEVRAGVVDGLRFAAHEKAADVATRALSDKADQVKIAGLEALVDLAIRQGGDLIKTAVDGLKKALTDGSWRVRAAAVSSSVDLWNRDCVGLLVEALDREQIAGGGRLLIDLGVALQLYTGKTMGYDADLWRSWWNAQKDKFELGKKPKRDKYGVLEGMTGPADDEKTKVTFYSLPILSKRVAFVFDLSGSMKNPASDDAAAKPKIDLAREQMSETLKKFEKTQWFNVVIYRYFSGFPPETKTETAFPRKLMPADPPRKRIAREFMTKQEPRGWGNFYEGILAAMDIEEVDTIYFLSDGKPSRGRYVRTDGLLEQIAKENRFRRVMIHTILTGEKGTDERFMKALAGITWGFSTKG